LGESESNARIATDCAESETLCLLHSQVWVDKAIAAREKELSVRYKSNVNSAFLTVAL
jgi:hypothetical protein